MFGLRLPRPLSYVHAHPPKLSGFAVHPGGKAPEEYHWRLQSDTSSKSLKDSCDEPVTLTLPLSSSWTSDRKSTRLNSSHSSISYAVFCLKKKKKIHNT